ncbi:3-oxoacyl-acyl-carrier-protein reductase [Aphelenchoides avenae]|nr:3-oxoacyl-acyl-carrier-protein reductase [Aphelenchus avenae]
MSGRFAGKAVIITGSSSGIGQDAAVGFAKEGAFVTIHGQSEKGLQDTKKLIADAGVGDDHVQVVRGSLEDPKTIDALVEKTLEKFGRIDVVINNAGIYKHPDHDINSPESFDYVFSVNVKSAVMLTQKAAPHLEKTKGNVINVSSDLAKRTFPDGMFYSMSKAAMDHFTKNAANIYSPKGIRVNTLNPGLIRTPFRTRHGVPDAAEEGIQKLVGSVLPLRRAGEPHEMTAVLLFLASDQASFVTGATWHADGGGNVTPMVATSIHA